MQFRSNILIIDAMLEKLNPNSITISTRKKMNCQLEHLECQTDYIGVLTMG